MNMPTLCDYILIQKESQSVQGVNRYDILFAGMSNVWKRYLFANPVTYINLILMLSTMVQIVAVIQTLAVCK